MFWLLPQCTAAKAKHSIFRVCAERERVREMLAYMSSRSVQTVPAQWHHSDPSCIPQNSSTQQHILQPTPSHVLCPSKHANSVSVFVHARVWVCNILVISSFMGTIGADFKIRIQIYFQIENAVVPRVCEDYVKTKSLFHFIRVSNHRFLSAWTEKLLLSQ